MRSAHRFQRSNSSSVAAGCVDEALVVAAVVARLADGLGTFLASVAPGESSAMRERRAAWIELLRLAPKGLRFDQPSVGVLRGRLTELAHVVAAAIGDG